MSCNESITINELHFSSEKLYGRSAETQQLLDAFRRVRAPYSRSELVLITGSSGTGKSSLAQQLHEPATSTGGYFVCGKFDQQRRTEPYTAFASAFSELCDLLATSKDSESTQTVLAKVKRAVGAEGRLLTSVIPKLGELIDVDEEEAPSGLGLVEGRNGFNFAFRRFVRALCDSSHPIILCLDDVQWADSASLDLIRTLITDPQTSSLLVVVSYRDNEVNKSHPLTALLNDLSETVAMCRIALANFTVQALNTLVADLLALSEEETYSLTSAVHHKTLGNIFFVKQFLKTLSDDGMLWFCFGTLRWRWDQDRIHAKHVTDNVVELVVAKLRKMPPEAQSILSIAAFLGFSFEQSSLERIVDILSKSDRNRQEPKIIQCQNEKNSLADHLNMAIKEGLIEKEGINGHYRFVHDELQKAASMLVPTSERDYLQLHIGEAMLQNSTPGEVDANIFVIADLLNHGAALITDDRQRVQLMGLNVRAGEKAMSAYAFAPAASYFGVVQGLLKPDDWDDHYDLSLRLFNCAAEADYCTRNFHQVESSVDQVLHNARCYRDKYRANMIAIQSLAAQDRVKDALQTGFNVLAQYGVSFHSSPRKGAIVVELARTKLALVGRSKSSLTSLPETDNEDISNTMDLLCLMTLYSYLVRQDFVPLLVCRSVRLSIRHGLCRSSAPCFAAYGVILCGVLGNPKGGFKFGQVALELLDRFPYKDHVARTNVIVQTIINHWIEPAHLGLKPLVHAYKVGMEVGDVEHALTCIVSYCLLSFETGQQLAQLETEVRTYCEHAKELRQDNVVNLLVPIWQMALNLMGRSDNPVVLTGEAMDQDILLDHCDENEMVTVSFAINLSRLTMAYLFEDNALLASLLDGSWKASMMAHFSVWRLAFLEGLSSFALFRHTQKRKWRGRAKKSISKIRRWTKQGNVNTVHMLWLLEAENAAVNDDSETARRKYKLAISVAGRHGFCQDRAIACERAGDFFSSLGDDYWASHYYFNAHQYFFEWGAQAKANFVQRKHGALFTPEMQGKISAPTKSSAIVQHRSRHGLSGPSMVGSQAHLSGHSLCE